MHSLEYILTYNIYLMKLDTILILFYSAIPSNSISKIRTEAGGITNVPIS